MGDAPFLRVVRGEPDDTELAALTAVVLGLASARTEPEPETRSHWADRTALVRRPMLPFGPSAWRASGLPR